jgi:GTPase SAR1 family protein
VTDTLLLQLVVVGDQSTGKSSLLDSLTGFAFPRDSRLCTRYATQISCRRERQEYTEISIIPPSSASTAEQERLWAFRRQIPAGEALQFEKIFEDVGTVGLVIIIGGIRLTILNRPIVRWVFEGPSPATTDQTFPRSVTVS